MVVVVTDASVARSINKRNHSRGVGNPWGFAGAPQPPAALLPYDPLRAHPHQGPANHAVTWKFTAATEPLSPAICQHSVSVARRKLAREVDVLRNDSIISQSRDALALNGNNEVIR